MKNYKILLSYDGSRYFGWEHQPDQVTIQGKIEAVLEKLTGEKIEVIGAGRTDAGVHAKGMTANFRAEVALTEEELRDYMNHYLPDDISVDDLREASDRFHARYNAVGKLYCYTCFYGDKKPVFTRKYCYTLESEPDDERMRKAAKYLTGTHDFRSFCGNPKFKKSTVRTVDSIEIVKKKSTLYLNFHGEGFLQNMVRIMTGTLLEVGFGRMEPEDVKAILEAKDRKIAGPTAPAQGLCLMRVDY